MSPEAISFPLNTVQCVAADFVLLQNPAGFYMHNPSRAQRQNDHFPHDIFASVGTMMTCKQILFPRPPLGWEQYAPPFTRETWQHREKATPKCHTLLFSLTMLPAPVCPSSLTAGAAHQPSPLICYCTHDADSSSIPTLWEPMARDSRQLPLPYESAERGVL